jgi:hypothetical protein
MNEKLKEVVFSYLNTVTKGFKLFKRRQGYHKSELYSYWLVDTIKNNWFCLYVDDSKTIHIRPYIIDELRKFFGLGYNETMTIIANWFGNIINKEIINVDLSDYSYREDLPFPKHQVIKTLGENDVISESVEEDKFKKIIFFYLDKVTEGSNIYRSRTEALRLINPQTKKYYVGTDGSEGWVNRKLLDDLHTLYNGDFNTYLTIIGEWFETILEDITLDGVRVVHIDDWGTIDLFIKAGEVVKELGGNSINENFDEQSIWSNEKLQKVVFKYLDLVSEGYELFEEKRNTKNKELYFVNTKNRTWIWVLDSDKNLISNEKLVIELTEIFGLKSKYDCNILIILWIEKMFNITFYSSGYRPHLYKRTIQDIIDGNGFVKLKSLDGDSINENKINNSNIELEKYANELSKKMYCDRYGSCVHFAEEFVELINRKNKKLLNNFTVIEGYVYTNNGKFQHTWIELNNGTKIDPTFEQFNNQKIVKITKKRKINAKDYLEDTSDMWFKNRRIENPHYVFKNSKSINEETNDYQTIQNLVFQFLEYICEDALIYRDGTDSTIFNKNKFLFLHDKKDYAFYVSIYITKLLKNMFNINEQAIKTNIKKFFMEKNYIIFGIYLDFNLMEDEIEYYLKKRATPFN